MARKNWYTERKYDATKVESAFEKLVKSNGYVVTAYKEYVSKTEYKIHKDNVEVEFSLPYTVKSASQLFKGFEMYFNAVKKYEQKKANT